MRKIVIIFFILMFHFFSCKHTNKFNCIDNDGFINNFSIGVSENCPPKNFNLIFYIRLENGRMLQTNNLYLFEIYSKEFKEKFDYENFLGELFYEKIKLSDTIFNLKSKENILFDYNQEYLKTPIDTFKHHYFNDVNNHLILKNSSLSLEDRSNVLLKFFKNKYYISFDDVGGYFILYKKISSE